MLEIRMFTRYTPAFRYLCSKLSCIPSPSCGTFHFQVFLSPKVNRVVAFVGSSSDDGYVSSNIIEPKDKDIVKKNCIIETVETFY